MIDWASYHRGNILDYESKVDIIAHQVNCQGIMGGGLALQIKNKWPKVFKSYSDFVNKSVIDMGGRARSFLLGACQVVQISSNFGIANLFGQYDIGNGRQTDYEALFKSLCSLRKKMLDLRLTSVAFPLKLGCGLAGGNWNIVSALIKDAFDGSGVSIIFVEYSPKG